jgi:hypothetical protein
MTKIKAFYVKAVQDLQLYLKQRNQPDEVV